MNQKFLQLQFCYFQHFEKSKNIFFEATPSRIESKESTPENLGLSEPLKQWNQITTEAHYNAQNLDKTFKTLAEQVYNTKTLQDDYRGDISTALNQQLTTKGYDFEQFRRTLEEKHCDRIKIVNGLYEFRDNNDQEIKFHHQSVEIKFYAQADQNRIEKN